MMVAVSFAVGVLVGITGATVLFQSWLRRHWPRLPETSDSPLESVETLPTSEPSPPLPPDLQALLEEPVAQLPRSVMDQVWRELTRLQALEARGQLRVLPPARRSGSQRSRL